MLLIIVAVGFLGVSVVANLHVSRRDGDPLVRHERALSALRGIAEHRRPVPCDAVRAGPVSLEHVRILDQAPAPSLVRARARGRKNRTTRRRTTVRRPNAVEVASRPTIALVPAQAHPVWAVLTPAEGESAPEPERAEPRAPDIAPSTANGDARRGVSPMRALVVAAAFVVIAAVGATALSTQGGHTRQTRPPAIARSPRPVDVRSQTTPRTAAALPPPIQLVATTQGENTVTIAPPFTLTLTSTGDCWARIQTETGQTLFEGTLHAGQHQQITRSTALVIRLGNTPAITLAVNGAPLDLSNLARTADVRFVTS